MKRHALRLDAAPFVAIVLASLALAACGKDTQKEAAYKAACEGPPLRTVEQREAAMQAGYEINEQYRCIDKASFEAEKKRKAAREAANTPEAKAQREAEYQKRSADAAAKAAAERRDAEAAAAKPIEPLVIRPVDANTATESELAEVIAVGAEGARQIVAERAKGRFRDWPDLVNRVSAVHAAQIAAYASVGGLTVNGESLSGAPPDGRAAAAYKKRQER